MEKNIMSIYAVIAPSISFVPIKQGMVSGLMSEFATFEEALAYGREIQEIRYASTMRQQKYHTLPILEAKQQKYKTLPIWKVLQSDGRTATLERIGCLNKDGRRFEYCSSDVRLAFIHKANQKIPAECYGIPNKTGEEKPSIWMW
jgi:hypothetical protein